MKVGSVEVLVRYNPGLASCPNMAAASAGIELEAGQRVTVFGHFIDFGSEEMIDTCPSTEFYIKPAD